MIPQIIGTIALWNFFQINKTLKLVYDLAPKLTMEKAL